VLVGVACTLSHLVVGSVGRYPNTLLITWPRLLHSLSHLVVGSVGRYTSTLLITWPRLLHSLSHLLVGSVGRYTNTLLIIWPRLLHTLPHRQRIDRFACFRLLSHFVYTFLLTAENPGGAVPSAARGLAESHTT
jgi:hypothetical protein